MLIVTQNIASAFDSEAVLYGPEKRLIRHFTLSSKKIDVNSGFVRSAIAFHPF